MADKTEFRMNLAAVKRVDPYAKDIVDSSAHVAFYTFNSEENEWEKTDVEGVFFIYSRNAEPFHSIFINNRLNTNSFVEPITGQLELQSQPPFLLYRNERSRIRGFWFYNSSECDRIGELVGRLIKECDLKVSGLKNVEMMRSNSNNVDIFTMLSKAQEDFNNSQSQSNNRMPTTAASTTVNNQPDVTSQSVMNFFAAAKPAAASEVPLFQRLLSKPVSVDQIEKQQRATTPQDGRMTPPNLHSVSNLGQQQQQPFCSTSAVESAMNLMNVNSSKQVNQDPGTSPLAKFLVTSTMVLTGAGGGGGGQHRTLSASEIETPQNQLQQLLRKESSGILPAGIGPGGQQITANKPALMPPTMFLSSSASSSSSSSKTALKDPTLQTNCVQRQHSVDSNSILSPSGSFPRPEPLTQTQLVQAMMYMIQNDPEFIKKLHEAYLKSFTEMVSL